MPYFSYAKGDKKDEPRVSIRARVCADAIEVAGANRVVTMDLHAPQIQGFFRIPVGYTQLYSVCSQVGADAIPPGVSGEGPQLEKDFAKDEGLAGYRWMTVVLFGESTGSVFERGVGQ